MQKDVVGFNEEKMNKLIIEIFDYANKVNKIFNQANELIENTKTFYDCESGNKFREKYMTLSDNYKIINQNILSYAKELTTVKKKYTTSGQQIGEDFNFKSAK